MTINGNIAMWGCIVCAQVHVATDHLPAAAVWLAGAIAILFLEMCRKESK